MTKNTLIGINNVSKKVGKIYLGVNGIAKKIKKGYIGINGFAKLFYSGDPVLIYENTDAGTHTLDLAAGRYEITLIGGGGGGAGARSTAVNNHHYAQGGVGGTLQFIANLATSANIQIVVGTGGTTNSFTFAGAGSSATGITGGATTITGFTNLTASAGGGTAANISSTSSSGCNRNVGVIGMNILSGSALQEILINNPNACVSGQSTSTGTTRTATGRINSNWSNNTSEGKSGDHGWNNTTMMNMVGSSGYVRIVML